MLRRSGYIACVGGGGGSSSPKKETMERKGNCIVSFFFLGVIHVAVNCVNSYREDVAR